MEHAGDNYTNWNWCVWNSITKGTGGLGSWWTGGDHPNDSIIENGQNSEKSPGNSSEKPSANADVKSSNE